MIDDPCVWNKTIKGKQLTICFHVDDCKISNVNVRVVDYTIDWLRKEYESIFTNGSGKKWPVERSTRMLA